MAEEWVEIEWLVADPAARRSDLPDDTRQVGYRARTRGIATDPVVGQTADVHTPTGRRQTGQVVAIRPGYHHSFGAPLAPWVRMRESIRALLHNDGPGQS